MSATIRPLYSRNMGVPAESSTTLARCGTLWVTRPFSTVLTSVGTSAFHCERRACVRERDFFLLGTAMTISLSPDRGKPRIRRARPTAGRAARRKRGEVPSAVRSRGQDLDNPAGTPVETGAPARSHLEREFHNPRDHREPHTRLLPLNDTRKAPGTRLGAAGGSRRDTGHTPPWLWCRVPLLRECPRAPTRSAATRQPRLPAARRRAPPPTVPARMR